MYAIEREESKPTKSKEDDSDSSSGYLRRSIGPTKKRLVGYIAEAKSRSYDYAAITDLGRLARAVGEGIDNCTKDLNRIKNTSKLLQDYHDKWLNGIARGG